MLEKIWNQFSPKQLDYLVNIVKNSDAKTVCEIGTFTGSVARPLWKGIKDSDKVMYLVDNYHFLPEKIRDNFFKLIKKSMGNSSRIHTILEDSHEYDWSQHDFVIFDHETIEHMVPDIETALTSDIKYLALYIDEMEFQRTSFIFEAIADGKLIPQYYLHGLFICGKDELKCDYELPEGQLFGHTIKYLKTPFEHHLDIQGGYYKAKQELLSAIKNGII
mgnify:FL=1|tara:strand:+ start:1047 stop:1703 length:657 start_codon:yes stop_codon:yes gene_type:complete